VPRHNVGHFKGEPARAHYLSIYQAAMAELPPSEPTDVPTSFGTVRAYRFDGPPSALYSPVVVLPGRNASTPMWRVNMPALLEHRSVIGIDLLGEAGMSVQDKPITGPDDEAQWLDDALAGLGLDRVHLMGCRSGAGPRSTTPSVAPAGPRRWRCWTRFSRSHRSRPRRW
jgi:pimeloyl-ACP methyl ester carboxylesterase